MPKKVSKKEAEKKINEFFSELNKKDPKEIKKIKRFSMKNKVLLKENKKLFCKKCFHQYKNPKIRIKNKLKTIVCENCNYISRWKIKKN